jgi:PKD repeat protein
VIWGLTINNNHKVLLEVAAPDGSRGYARSNSRIPTNEWTHVAGTYDGASVKIYVNGRLEDTRSFNEPLALNNEPFSIGRSSYGNNYFPGKLDEVRVYNRSLSSTEISELYSIFNEVPVANAGGPYTGTEGALITFDGSQSEDPDPYGKIVKYYWDFGDGSTGEDIQTAHIYTQDGSYPVSLEVTDNMGATNREIIFVSVLDTPPLADFSGTPVVGSSPLTVTFTDSSDSHDGIAVWYWEFGDDENSTAANPIYTYTQEGAYTVSLRAKEADGDQDIETKTNYILVTTNEPPVADAGGPYTGTESTDITFNGSNSYDPDGTITAWLWEFGDGETSSDESPTHFYASDGRYTIALTVTDNRGANGTDTTEIVINAHQTLNCTLIAPDTTIQATSAPITFQARVTSQETPIADATVVFSINGVEFDRVQSDRGGYAICQHSPSSGNHQWSAQAIKPGYTAGTSMSRQFTYTPSLPSIPWANYLVIMLLVIAVWISFAYFTYRQYKR